MTIKEMKNYTPETLKTIVKTLDKILTVNCGKYENGCEHCPHFSQCETYGQIARYVNSLD